MMNFDQWLAESRLGDGPQHGILGHLERGANGLQYGFVICPDLPPGAVVAIFGYLRIGEARRG